MDQRTLNETFVNGVLISRLDEIDVKQFQLSPVSLIILQKIQLLIFILSYQKLIFIMKHLQVSINIS